MTPLALQRNGRVHFAEWTPEHQLDEAVPRDFTPRLSGNVLAVAEHRYRVAEVEHLTKAVTNIDDRMSLRLDQLEHAENAFDFGIRESRRGLREHPHAAWAAQ